MVVTYMKKIVAGVIVFALLAGGWFVLRQGITVEIRNVSDEPMKGLVVHVTGNSYPIGDLLAGETKSIAVAPTGESHVELEFEGHERLVVECYFEPGYSGLIKVKVTPMKVISVDDGIR